MRTVEEFIVFLYSQGVYTSFIPKNSPKMLTIDGIVEIKKFEEWLKNRDRMLKKLEVRGK